MHCAYPVLSWGWAHPQEDEGKGRLMATTELWSAPEEPKHTYLKPIQHLVQSSWAHFVKEPLAVHARQAFVRIETQRRVFYHDWTANSLCRQTSTQTQRKLPETAKECEISPVNRQQTCCKFALLFGDIFRLTLQLWQIHRLTNHLKGK